ncbi:MAG: propanediol utilization protein [Lachnospiraceae bacterium]|nr:propanediol utilization protein [Lachnospiraceae bacterium]
MSNNCTIGISARHVHLSKEHADILFGKDYEFTPKPGVEPKGQWAVQERVELIAPKSSFPKMGIICPTRDQTQVEISKTDAFALGLKAPIRMSGDLAGSAGDVIIRGPKGEIHLEEGVIVAKRHVHIGKKFAEAHGITQGQVVKLKVETDERSLVFDDVIARIGGDGDKALVHLDTDEGNAADLPMWSEGEIIAD